MDFTFGTPEEIFQLTTIICCDDDFEGKADVAVIFGETKINTGWLGEALTELWQSKMIWRIGVSAGYSLGEPIVASFEEIKEMLCAYDVIPETAIVQFPLSKRLPPCTDAEAIGLVDFAKEQGWKSVYLVAPPMHQFRAFYSLASAIIKAGSDLVVWNWVTRIREWNERIIHSQSAPEDKRLNLLAGELEKIERYFRKGDHVPAREVLDYIRARYK